MIAYTALTLLVLINILPRTDAGKMLLKERGDLVFWLAVSIMGISIFVTSILQYRVWSGDDLSKLLLPPYQDINYFLFYSLMRFLAPYLISLAMALVIVKMFPRINERHEGRFFEEGEIHLAAVTLFLSGHPGWLIYFSILVLSYLLWHLYTKLITQEDGRLPLYSLWAPIGLLTVLASLTTWVSKSKIWLLLKI